MTTITIFILLQELASEEVADTQEGGERLLEQFAAQRDSTLDACASTIGEGKALLEEIKAKAEADTTGSVTAVTAALDRLAAQRDDLADLWTTRKMRLDLCLQVGLKLICQIVPCVSPTVARTRWIYTYYSTLFTTQRRMSTVNFLNFCTTQFGIVYPQPNIKNLT